jgi:hypothetical protein
VATPNYGYEKRQKELAKKRKKEDKLKAKADRKAGVPGDASPEDSGAGNQPPVPPQR